MWTQNITANGKVNTGLKAKHGIGWHVFGYSGNLGGGTARVYCRVTKEDGVTTDDIPVPDSKLVASDVDGDSDAIQMFEFRGFGDIIVELTGSSGANADFFVE